MLQAQDLSYTYPNGETLRFPDLTCAAGETRLLLGKSGSGKTTLLQLLAGLRSPATGSVEIDGTAVNTLTGSALDRFRGAKVGMVFQTAHFIRSVSIRDNLRLAQSLGGKPVDDRRIEELLTDLDVAHKTHAFPAKLSVGQQQRVAIARAVINQPAVILADEPTSALDDDNALQVLTLLQSQAAAVNAALLIVTHDNRLTSAIANQTTL
ncbi:ABC transporter ATP-binding protein [Neolewinella antarctica]|uniref:ABC transport system ATP-binding protein n=1 Tax=Neolewinella antarctica TaxID=442734 RepID=A0ABX0X705_9BACT|nr:ATP-binding cassette domain-containing protein [Neolewinella antarctica]NJC25002.1 putative ABC transport system ATP-binding protein [Neolewinella antarctica]